MAGLELRFLGDFEVRRDGRALPLPPSKKTRALLAYLCLQPKRFRRENLCELLWEVPDDPRGSLRWSLSKLRRLLDDRERTRVQADRDGVAIETDGVAIDNLELRKLAAGDLTSIPLDDLEAAAMRYRGNALEGLEFSNFHDFHSWCVSEREQSLRDRAALLTELAARLDGEPERALPHVRALVGLSPYEETHRATLIRLLNAARKFSEAEEQFQLGLRILKEAAIPSSGSLLAARRAPRIDAPPKPEPPPPVAAFTSIMPPTTGLFGREHEVALIAGMLNEVVRDSQSAVLLLTGAPGIGKTRVVNMTQALANDSGALVVRAATFESDTIRPFALWIDALRDLESGGQASLFADTDLANRDRLFARLSEFVARESARWPVVLLFDDVQWCDESSAAALHYVARVNRQRPFLSVLAARDSELRDNAPVLQALRGLRRDGLLREIELGPLAGDALVQLINERAPGADSQRLSVECGGNPLLAIELARAVTGGSAVGSLDDLVRERLVRLGVVGADVLRWAALLSPRIDVGYLVKVSGIEADAVGAALDVAQKHAMLQATDRGLDFAHELISRAVYNDISPLRRQVMHRRIAELLEKDSAQDLARASDLAHHAALSGDPGLAARAMVSAGRLCLRFFANDDALSLARKGLQLAEALPDAERVCVEIDLHDILLAARPLDDRDAAARLFTALAERALDHGALAHARLGYHMASWVRWTQGQWAAAREQSLQAARAVRGGQDEAHIVGMAETAKCLAMLERDLPQADAMLMEASSLAARKGISHHSIPAGLGMLRFHENHLDEAEEYFREARTLSKSAGDRVSEYQANEFLVMLDFQRGRHAAARRGCEELLALGDKLRGGSEEPFARAMTGLCDYAIDDETDGLEAALTDLRIADAKHRLAYILTRAALLDCERSRVESATARATEALEYATLLERATEMMLANAVLSHDCLAKGDRKGAANHAREAERIGGSGAAVWAHDIMTRLSGNNMQAANKGAI
jgi:DNA-binding SARP family transcriptional activator